MLIASLAFIGYAVIFLLWNFSGSDFELGVDTLNGVTRDNLNAINPAIVHACTLGRSVVPISSSAFGPYRTFVFALHMSQDAGEPM